MPLLSGWLNEGGFDLYSSLERAGCSIRQATSLHHNGPELLCSGEVVGSLS